MIACASSVADTPQRSYMLATRLGVQSRSEMGWIVSESPGLVCPSLADVLVGSEPPQGLEALSEVVGVEEGFEVLSELLVGLVVIAPNGGFLESASARPDRWSRDGSACSEMTSGGRGLRYPLQPLGA
mgnify:CR=1 FL=1